MKDKLLLLPIFEEEQQCRDCGEVKVADAFYFTSARNGKRETLCKVCKSMRSQASYRKREPGTNRQYWWKDRGIKDIDGSDLTYPRFMEILQGQGERCAICRAPEPGKYDWSPDHDHDSGMVRGILCNSCNMALGKMKDSPTLLRRAADYLEGKAGGVV